MNTKIYPQFHIDGRRASIRQKIPDLPDRTEDFNADTTAASTMCR